MTYETQVGVGKDDTVVIGSLDALGVHDGTARCCEVLDTALSSSVDIVREGEERIGRAGNALELLHVLFSFLFAQRRGNFVEQAFPLSTLRRVSFEHLTSDEEVDGVGLVGSLGTLLEGQCKNSRVVTQPPVIGLVACQSGAVNSRLLTSAETDDGTVQCVTNGVRLSVFQCQGSDGQVGDGLLGQLKKASVSVQMPESSHIPPCWK